MEEPLKVYGSLTERSTSYVARCGGKKRSFPFRPSSEDDRKRAKHDANVFLRQWTVQNKAVNTARTVNGVVHISVRPNASAHAVYDCTIDEADISIVRDHVWWVRIREDGGPAYVFSSGYKTQKTKRIQLHHLLCSTHKVVHADNNVLNNRRSNLIVSEAIIDENNDNDEQEKSLPSLGAYLRPDEPFIPRSVWDAYKNRAHENDDEEERVVELLSDALFKRYPTFPMPRWSQRELQEDTDGLKCAEAAIQDGMLPRGNRGQRFCKNFMLDVILLCGYRFGSKKILSPQDVWQDSVKRKRVIRAVLRKSDRVFTAQSLLTSLNFVFYVAANFSPTAAKAVIDRFCPENGHVLDPCSGWGGRFTGFWFSERAARYVGIDPNPRLPERYGAMEEWLRHNCPTTKPKTVRFVSAGAETKDAFKHLSGEQFDLVFTSPPYFDVEIYNVEDGAQSCNAYGESYETWREKFLFAMMRTCASVLRHKGYMVLNVANTRRCTKLVEDVRSFATSVLGLVFTEELRLPMSRRPGSKHKEAYENVIVLRNCTVAEALDDL